MKITVLGEIKQLFLVLRKTDKFAKSPPPALHGYMDLNDGSREKNGHITFHGNQERPITSDENTLHHPQKIGHCSATN